MAQWQQWREALSDRLRKAIGNPQIEEKELAAFDVVMSRRQVLHGAQLTAVAGLVTAGTPPTMWGRTDPLLHVPAGDVGLTTADIASVSTPAQLALGTELFQDTVYAQPVVSSEAVDAHALIEGARGNLRLRSDLEAEDPTFLDAGYHWGPPEVIQLEESADNGWEVVHYHHPWNARSDG
ncbi:MAG: hypothetical protein WA991_04330, partial [Ornithinimicrobium sp.]